MDALLHKIVSVKTIQVVGVYRNEEFFSYTLLLVKKYKSTLNVVESSSFADLDSLISKLDSKIPLLIVVDGKGVLNKRIDLKNETDVEWIKNLDYSTIHFLNYSTPIFQFLSFCRKNVADDIVSEFQKKGFQVLDLYVGCLTSVLLIKSLKKSKVFSNECILNFENDELLEVLKVADDKETKFYELGEKSISNFQLPLYGAAINFYIKQKSVEKSYSFLVNSEEIFYKKAFEKLGLSMVVGFFVLLLSSYSLIQYYNSKNTQLNLENVYSNQSYKLYENLEKQRDNKLRIVTETGISSSKFISFFNYELTASVPAQVNLSAIAVFPLIKDVKSNQKIDFNSKTILLKGSTLNEPIFNSWLERIRTFKWINNLEILSIKKDKNNVSYFELKISIKDV